MIESLYVPFSKLSCVVGNVKSKMATKSKKKSRITAYVLWVFGGLSGFHHFYLGRDLHGFLWWATLGGYFGLGWISDLFYISEYVAEANDEPEFQKKMKDIMRKNKKVRLLCVFHCISTMTLIYNYFDSHRSRRFGSPLWYYWLTFGARCISWLYRRKSSSVLIGKCCICCRRSLALWVILVFREIPAKLCEYFVIRCVTGVWAVGNVGQQKGSMWTPLLAAYLTLPLKYFMDESTAYTIMVLAAAYTFDSFEKQWKQKSKSSRGCMR